MPEFMPDIVAESVCQKECQKICQKPHRSLRLSAEYNPMVGITRSNVFLIPVSEDVPEGSGRGSAAGFRRKVAEPAPGSFRSRLRRKVSDKGAGGGALNNRAVIA